MSSEQQELFKHTTPSNIFPEFYLIKVNNFDDVVRNTLDEWIYFLKNEEIKPGFKAKGLQQAKKCLDIMKLSESERLEYSRYSDELHYQASMVESSYGVGKLHGRNETLEQTALKMLAKAIDFELIIEITGLSREQLEKLSSDKNQLSEPVAKYKASRKPKTPKPRSKTPKSL